MNKRKRVLVLVTLSEWGGAQLDALVFAQEAVRRGYEVLVAAGGHDELKRRCEAIDIPYHEVKRMTRSLNPLKDILVIFELIALMKSWKPSILQLHSSKASIVGSLAGRIANVPLIAYRIGGWSFLEPVSFLSKRIRLWSERLTASCKDVIFTLHPGDEQIAKRYRITPKKTLVTNPNGMDLETFDHHLLQRDEARRILTSLFLSGIPQNKRLNTDTLPQHIVLTVANFFPAKNLVQYVETIRLVIREQPGVAFLILGDGILRSEIENARTAQGVEAHLSLPGAYQKASTLFSGADLFVLPSVKEGMPWTMLEAMAAQLPIVATDVGANAWMTGGNAHIVPPNDPRALAQTILEQLKANDRSIQGMRLRKTVEERFQRAVLWNQAFTILEISIRNSEDRPTTQKA